LQRNSATIAEQVWNNQILPSPNHWSPEYPVRPKNCRFQAGNVHPIFVEEDVFLIKGQNRVEFLPYVQNDLCIKLKKTI